MKSFWPIYQFNPVSEEYELIFVSSIQEESIRYYNKLKSEDDLLPKDKRSHPIQPIEQTFAMLKHQIIKETLTIMAKSLDKIVLLMGEKNG